MGVVIEQLGQRRGEMKDMSAPGDGTVHLVYHVPTREVEFFGLLTADAQAVVVAQHNERFAIALLHTADFVAVRGAVAMRDNYPLTSERIANGQRRRRDERIGGRAVRFARCGYDDAFTAGNGLRAVPSCRG